MRQILVQSFDKHHTVDGHKLHLLAEHELILIPGVNMIRRPVPVKAISGGQLEFLFTTHRDISTSGVIYGGGYVEDGQIVVLLFNAGKEQVVIPEGKGVITGYAFEVVRLHKVDNNFDGFVLVGSQPTEKPKKARKKKRD